MTRFSKFLGICAVLLLPLWSCSKEEPVAVDPLVGTWCQVESRFFFDGQEVARMDYGHEESELYLFLHGDRTMHYSYFIPEKRFLSSYLHEGEYLYVLSERFHVDELEGNRLVLSLPVVSVPVSSVRKEELESKGSYQGYDVFRFLNWGGQLVYLKGDDLVLYNQYYFDEADVSADSSVLVFERMD